MLTHKKLELVWMRAAEEIGCEVQRNPETHTLLLNEYTREQCQVLFPKKATTEALEIANELDLLLTALANPHALDTNTRAIVTNRVDEILLTRPGAEQHAGRKIDVHITCPDGQEFYIDVGQKHTTADTYCSNTYQHLSDPTRRNSKRNTPAVAAAVTHKHTKYRPLMQKANSQIATGIRAKPPTFYAPIISHRCEFSHDTFTLIEKLASVAHRRSRTIDEFDGLTPSERSAHLRTRLKDRLVAAMATGWAEQLATTGFPLGLSRANCS